MSPGRVAAFLLGWLALGALLAPLVFAAWISFSPDSFLTPPTAAWSGKWYAAFFEDRRWTAALGRSAVVALAGAAIATAAGVPLAYAVVRHRFRGRTALAVAAIVPLCVPPAVLGMGMLPLMHAAGLWGTLAGLALAHALVALPVSFLVARAYLEQIDPDLEAAARGLGATAWQAATRVTLPLLWPAVLAGGAAAFLVSLNEAMVTLFLATPSTETLPAVVWPELRHAPTPAVAVASCLSAGVAVVGVALFAALRSWRGRFG
jgi:ABC-type spermidine/putrescine transport system permease subunit II